MAALREADPGSPVLEAGGYPVEKQELSDAFMDLFSKPSSEDTYESVARETLNTVMSRHYLFLEAKQRGLEVDAETWLQWKVKSRFWIGITFMGLKGKDFVVPEEILAQLIPEDARAFKLHQLTLPDLAAAQDILSRINEGQRIEGLAPEYSIDPVALRGGGIKDWQVMAMGNIYGDEILGKLVNVEQGRHSEIIRTPIGYTIFRVDEKRPLSDSEKTGIRTRHRNELQNGMVNAYLEQVRSKYPLEIKHDALNKALGENNPEAVVALVGNFPVTLKFMRTYAYHLMVSVDRPADDNLETWVRVINLMSPGLAMTEEAMAQGFGDDPMVQENLARVKKYSLATTMIATLARQVEPTEEELYTFYREKFGNVDEPGVFSVDGARDIDFETAEKIRGLLESGTSLDEALSAVSLPDTGERLSGTFKDGDFDRATLLVLEKTPSGEVAGPIGIGLSYGVYRITGKRRGEMPPYDQVRELVRAQYTTNNSSDQRSDIIVRQSKANPVKYFYTREVIDKVIGEWLDLQKALRGVSPPGGFHQRGGPSEIIVPGGGQRPAGHP
ncbi:MAG: peptidylprolyl isomerase [bacterium]|nr:peptidylprolyl isomerase [bacterium]